jgi:prepilin-type processing-associated H-X9-DG protein
MWGFAINNRLSRIVKTATGRTYLGLRVHDVRFPQLTVSLFDVRAGIVSMRGPDTATTRERLYGIYPRDFVDDILRVNPGAFRHRGKANYLFVDGHVESFGPGQLEAVAKSNGRSPGFGL